MHFESVTHPLSHTRVYPQLILAYNLTKNLVVFFCLFVLLPFSLSPSFLICLFLRSYGQFFFVLFYSKNKMSPEFNFSTAFCSTIRWGRCRRIGVCISYLLTERYSAIIQNVGKMCRPDLGFELRSLVLKLSPSRFRNWMNFDWIYKENWVCSRLLQKFWIMYRQRCFNF